MNNNIAAFLHAVPHIQQISNKAILKLSERFSISPDMLALLIKIATDGGGICEN
jgi:hypothetical protein